MRFLVIYREDTRMSAAVPPPVLLELVHATGSWIEEIKKSGKSTDAGFMSSEHGGFAIFDVASGAELADLTDSCPARPFCSVETMGLMTPKEAEPVLAKAKTRAAEAMQMMAKFAGPR
jgi:muconolactone delta-isomerase